MNIDTIDFSNVKRFSESFFYVDELLLMSKIVLSLNKVNKKILQGLPNLEDWKYYEKEQARFFR